MTPEELGRELRESDNQFLARRRMTAALSLFSIATMGVIALYQIGAIKHLPEPPIPGLDADKVNGSAQAYELLNTPDAVLALGSYAVTLGLVAIGGAERARTQPIWPLLAGAKAIFDALAAAKLTVDQKTKHQAFCLYCLSSVAATFAALAGTLPEARAALKNLRHAD